MSAALAALGYAFVKGPSGDPSDWVLRQTDPDHATEGFVWKGQENYDAVGEAVNATIREMLVTHCKLVEVVTDLAPASCWASPDWREHRGPTLVLVCGNTPGGEAGVWGRALCVNQTTLQGAMFDYIARARAKGWAVVVADPHTDATPHLHVIRLMEGPLKSKQRLLVVAHSYGAPCTLGMVKSTPSALQRIDALAFTDGMAWTPRGWTYKAILHESVPSDSELEAEAQKQATAEQDANEVKDIAQLRDTKLQALRAVRDRRAEFARLAPAAFQPPSADVAAFVAQVGCNWVTSEEPLGQVVELEDSCVPTVSAAHASHPSTTFSATEDVFRFLNEAVCRANDECNNSRPAKKPKT